MNLSVAKESAVRIVVMSRAMMRKLARRDAERAKKGLVLRLRSVVRRGLLKVPGIGGSHRPAGDDLLWEIWPDIGGDAAMSDAAGGSSGELPMATSRAVERSSHKHSLMRRRCHCQTTTCLTVSDWLLLWWWYCCYCYCWVRLMTELTLYGWWLSAAMPG